MKITRLNYELAPKFRSEWLAIEAAVEYDDALLSACGSKKRAKKMFERILLYRIENCSDNIHNDCWNPERQRDWNLSRADEVIGLLKELGREDDLKWWTAYRALIASRRNDRRRVR